MWISVANAVDRSKVKMFWSPVGPFGKDNDMASLNNDWYPGDDVVDIVGIDAVSLFLFMIRELFTAIDTNCIPVYNLTSAQVCRSS